MQRHRTLQAAAVVARVFRIDPITVLNETDQTRMAARVAAAEYVMQLEADAAQTGRR